MTDLLLTCSAMYCSFVEEMAEKVLNEMLDGVEGPNHDAKLCTMFTQWLQPDSNVTAGNPDETYRIVESLLTVHYGEWVSSQAHLHPWQCSDIDALGSMKVLRVSDTKKGKQFVDMLSAFLQETSRPGSGPAWAGHLPDSLSPRSARHSVRWLLFAIIKDFSQDEASKKLQQNVPAWFLKRQLPSSHPAVKHVNFQPD